jgi:hypothetical protein
LPIWNDERCHIYRYDGCWVNLHDVADDATHDCELCVSAVWEIMW